MKKQNRQEKSRKRRKRRLILRGSGTLKQLPDEVLALERNQQAEDESERNLIKIRVLKNRFAGSTGLAGYLHWDKDRHRLLGEEDESCQEF